MIRTIFVLLGERWRIILGFVLASVTVVYWLAAQKMYSFHQDTVAYPISLLVFQTLYEALVFVALGFLVLLISSMIQKSKSWQFFPILLMMFASCGISFHTIILEDWEGWPVRITTKEAVRVFDRIFYLTYYQTRSCFTINVGNEKGYTQVIVGGVYHAQPG